MTLTNLRKKATICTSINYRCVACNVGSSCMNAITRARWTRRMGSFRDAAKRLIVVTSSVVNVRSLIDFRIWPPGDVPQKDYTSHSWRENH